jgi:probable F420-dependent oxidoreductase
MKIDTGLHGEITEVADAARRAEEAGYDGLFGAEMAHDPFLPIALAAQATTRAELGTGIAVAFARNPMTIAMIGHDLQRLSNGRFLLGLGSQIKPHITKRFSMPWSNPAPRMREFILAMRAIWNTWDTGERLAFRGEFYKYTLMTPMFDPGPNRFGPPPVLLAAVGPLMTTVAAEVADGLVAHAFTTPEYFREVTMAAVERGLATSGRTRSAFQISMPLFVVTGHDEEQLRANAKPTRAQLAFYGSTPAYRAVLEHHGWGELGDELNVLSKRGEWEKMGDAITDEVLQAFAIVGEPASIAPAIEARFGGLLDRVQLFAADRDDHTTWAPVLDAIRTISGRGASA